MCRCGARWTGANRAHCAACHRTFGGVGGFDAHRPGECLDPAALGMELRRGVWVQPLPEGKRARLAALKAA